MPRLPLDLPPVRATAPAIAQAVARATTLAVSLLCTPAQAVFAAEPDDAPRWTAEGHLELPRNYREWVFLGAPLTPNALNGGAAGFPEFHNVYIQRHALEAYRNTGSFAEGTVLLKELQLVRPGNASDGSTVEASGRGYFPGDPNGIDVAVKDSRRFAETNGWGFFNFGHHAPPYAETAAPAPAEACAACHAANATEEMVFTKFYRVILDKR
ncbi:MAG: cytochrome P460 family protein [Gammaproteobacteria bacterium]